MSWHFSQALEEEYSQASSWGGEPCVRWKSMPTAQDDSCSDKMKATCHRSPFGMMYVPSTDAHGEALLMWYQGASPAPTSALQERRLESTETKADSGWKWRESFVKYDLATRSWRTRQCSLIGDSNVFSETWPRWGLMLDGECFPLPMLALTTKGRGAGLWPTPCHGSSKWGGTFQEVGGSQNKLRNTPIGKLYVNPDFWENLMGWPIGWTGTAPLEMAKTQEWMQLHSICSPADRIAA